MKLWNLDSGAHLQTFEGHQVVLETVLLVGTRLCPLRVSGVSVVGAYDSRASW
jgi:hypothetical protein